MFPGLEIVGVNGYQFSAERLRTAVEQSKDLKHVELLTLDAERYLTFDLEYEDGRQYWSAVRRTDRIDRLADIATARRPDGPPDPTQNNND